MKDSSPSSPDFSGSSALLGVMESYNKAFWRFRPYDHRLCRDLQQKQAMDEIQARLIAARLPDGEDLSDYLKPTLRRMLPDPYLLQDMRRAAQRFAQAVSQGEKIGIIGDYDVDGSSSTALLRDYLTRAGCESAYHIPDRLTEGYGPNIPAIDKLLQQGCSLLICVDCGTTAHEPLAHCAAQGYDMIVLDHHAVSGKLPPACAIVNPNRTDDQSNLGHLCACAVVFMFCVAVNRLLREEGYFHNLTPEPDLRDMLDLVALATICDVVPLTGLNRCFVIQGLKIMEQRKRIGLAGLVDHCTKGQKLTAYHLGYQIGPRINASGRVGRSDLGTLLLSNPDKKTVFPLIEQVEQDNNLRRATEQMILAEIEEQAGDSFTESPVIVAAGQGWHPGVIGIIAGRLKERYHKPSCVIALNAENMGTASARSIPGFDIGAVVAAAQLAGCIEKGGGHPMAAGFSLSAEQIPLFYQFLQERFRKSAEKMETTQRVYEVDSLLSPAAAQIALAKLLEQLEPYGAAHPEPRFVMPEMRIIKPRIVGENHISCIIAGYDGTTMRAIAFRAADTDLGQAFLAESGQKLFHLAGIIRSDHWNGEDRVQFQIQDAAPF